ncbi:oxidoreductase [Emericellopsis atlantica]|uniref:Oxidoreductase n=1 Tax=Emericellopsis atlantica TaxID=2614577 RepID=A0A9P7ZE57_9HYPO|nr:oxidoreductase [Emericellopsis atlantica]KAG9250478.1 oxidoreductase [Emericellopsis atlantica]
MKEENVHDPKYREAKEAQSSPSVPTSQLFRLDNRTIIVTGAGGFLGTTVAKTIIESGGDVVCLDLVENPQSVYWKQVLEAADHHGRNVHYYPCNVQDADAMADIFARFLPLLQSPIRGLVSCAGVSDNGPATDFPVRSFQRLLDINVTGTFTAAQLVVKEVIKAGLSASMVFVASMSGYVSNKGVDTAGYNASKAAVHQLARSLAAEWGSRVNVPLIRVNTLSPGYIRTEATAEALRKPGMESQWVGDSMLYRLSNVDEYRAPILFLLGDGSSYMTGADLRVDGGHCAW